MEMHGLIEYEIKQDNKLPVDHLERLKAEKLIKWMHENGGKFGKVKIRYYANDFRGIESTHSIKSGEQIAFVPLRLMITTDVCKATPIGQQLIKAQFEGLEVILGAAYLLQES
jgi:hypothetical protein